MGPEAGAGGESEPEVDFRSFARKAVAESRRKEGTKKNLYSTLNLLEEYLPGFSWVDMNHAFVKGFEVWLGRHGYARNTVIMHLRNLRTFVGAAIAEGYMKMDDIPLVQTYMCDTALLPGRAHYHHSEDSWP